MRKSSQDLFEREQGLRFHDRAFFRVQMKTVDVQRVCLGIDVDEIQSGGTGEVVCAIQVGKCRRDRVFPVFLFQLVVNIGRQVLAFETDREIDPPFELIRQAAIAFDGIQAESFDTGQHRLFTIENFRHVMLATSKLDNMATRSNLNGRSVRFVLMFKAFAGFEKFRMKRTCKKRNSQVRRFRT